MGKKNDDKVYFVYGKDVNKVKNDIFSEGVSQSELNNPVEMLNMEQREILGDLYLRGNNYKESELGLQIFVDDNGKSGSKYSEL